MGDMPWLPLALGTAAFALMFCSDFCTLRKKNRLSGLCFVLGGLMLIGATAWILAGCDFAALFARQLPLRLAALAAAVGFAALLLYTLFFALPFDSTYLAQQQLSVVDNGVYALCRHPGVLWLAGVYLFLWLFSGQTAMLIAGLLFSALNVCYVWWQDRFVFPITLAGYGAYQREVPFLLPGRRSIKRAMRKKSAFRAK